MGSWVGWGQGLGGGGKVWGGGAGVGSERGRRWDGSGVVGWVGVRFGGGGKVWGVGRG